jgi:ATP-dependent DNA helicase PIF1
MGENKNKRWTLIMDNDLLLFIDNKYSIDKICELTGRSKLSIKSRIETLLLDNNEYNDIFDYLSHKLRKKNIKNIVNEILDNTINSIIGNDYINDIDNIILSEEQQKGFEIAKDGKNIFITGIAGTGKSFLLKKIIKYFENNEKNIGVTSSTGVSALLIGGTTLHSFLKIGLGKDSSLKLYEKLKEKKYYNKEFDNLEKLENLEILIIDEISMISYELFIKISEYLSLIKTEGKTKTKIFGGIQIILTGDFAQLSPINSNKYCFESKIWELLNLEIINLQIQFRQGDDELFKQIVNSVRFDNLSNEYYNILLNTRDNEFNDNIVLTKLFSLNKDIDLINQLKYDELLKENKEFCYPVIYDKKNKHIEYILKNAHIPQELKLCEGLHIIITYNIDIEYGIVNGTKAIITNLYDSGVDILTYGCIEYKIKYVIIEDINKNYDKGNYDIIRYSYIPIKLGYACSIHSSQGSTLNYVEMDLGNSIFANGQAYTALSRAKSLKTLKITGLRKKSFIYNKKVKEFYTNLLQTPPITAAAGVVINELG